LQGQDKVSGRRIINVHDSTSMIRTSVLPKSKSNVSLKEGRYYAWFSYNQIYYTENGVGGNLIDGNFQSFYFNNQLKTSGKYRKGLKAGYWKSWYDNGTLNELTKWKKGQLHGERILFNSLGDQVLREKYKRNVIQIPRLKGIKKKEEKQNKMELKKELINQDSSNVEPENLQVIQSDSLKIDRSNKKNTKVLTKTISNTHKKGNEILKNERDSAYQNTSSKKAKAVSQSNEHTKTKNLKENSSTSSGPTKSKLKKKEDGKLKPSPSKVTVIPKSLQPSPADSLKLKGQSKSQPK